MEDRHRHTGHPLLGQLTLALLVAAGPGCGQAPGDKTNRVDREAKASRGDSGGHAIETNRREENFERDREEFGWSIPPRPADAPGGLEIFRQVESLPLEDRERILVREIVAGNVPSFLRPLVAIHTSALFLPRRASEASESDSESRSERGALSPGQEIRREATYYVTSDYLAVGDDDDFWRVPLTPASAQSIADAFGATLITTKVSDEIYASAQVRLAPRPLTRDRERVETFYEHHQRVEDQLRGKSRGRLVAGIKKDVVLSNQLKGHADRVAIYGWHGLDGLPIQPLYIGHHANYVDYSHGIRLMAREMLIDGERYHVREVLASSELCSLLSDEGALEIEVLGKDARDTP